MNKNICSECGTENEEEYNFCKNCGARIIPDSSETQFKSSAPDYSAPNYNDRNSYYGSYNTNAQNPYSQSGFPNTAQNGFYTDTVEGIPTDEVSAFIGKSSHKILPKLCKMEVTNSKVSWCWPAAILGIIFGPIGSAVWFLYRKMYKIALIFLAASMLLVGVSFGVMSANGQIDEIKSAFSGDISDAEAFSEEITELLSSDSSNPLGEINGVFELVSGLFSGLFGLYWYKRHIAKRITKFRQDCVNPNYYQMGLKAVGGTSVGMVFAGIVIIYLAIVALTSLILFI